MRKIIAHASGKMLNKDRVYAAEEDDFAFDDEDMVDVGDEDVQDTLDDMADSIEDMQDTLDEVQEDDVDIELTNNIAEHYIAECDSCQGVFISAVVYSDQEVEKITGVCPLCGKETDQYLKWVIKDVNDLDKVGM